jgi:hypothetical protein
MAYSSLQLRVAMTLVAAIQDAVPGLIAARLAKVDDER